MGILFNGCVFCLGKGQYMPQQLGVVVEEIHAQSLGDEHELLRVDNALLENLVHGADVHINPLGQPAVGLALAAQLLTNELPDG